MKNFALSFAAKTNHSALIAGTVALSMAASAPAFAQTLRNVLLLSEDGSMSVSGKLVNVDSEFYTIEGQHGVIQVPRNAVGCTGAACPILETSPLTVVPTREVTLNSIDDETRISGELIDFDETHYVVRNSVGEFRIKISGVTCEGPACPVMEVFDTEFAIHVTSGRVGDMLVDLFRDYANETGQTFEVAADGDTTKSVQIFTGADLELIADIDLIVSEPLVAASALSKRAADIIVYNQDTIDAQLSSVAGLGPVSQNVLAFDGGVIVGNRDNPVRDLSIPEINQILSQNLTSWRGLGGGDFPISIHMVDDASATTSWLNEGQAYNSAGVVLHDTEEQVINIVNADRNAIGVVHRTNAVVENAKMLAVREACGLTAEPTPFDLRTERYPFTQPLNFYTREDSADPFVSSFLEWAQTSAAASTVSRWGYIGTGLQRTQIQNMGVAIIHAAAEEPDFDGVEFSAMMRELRSADRLSMTFTFQSGSTILDEDSSSHLEDLAQRLRGAEFSGQEVILVGFADNIGPAGRNSALSLRRAESVRAALAQEFDPATLEQLSLTSMGFGEQIPLACNDTDVGRADNRRVEVWVRFQG